MSISRRDLLKSGLLAAGAAGAGSAIFSGSTSAESISTSATGQRVYRWAKPVAHRRPGSLPFPHLAPGTDTMPEIEHIIVLMMENHSYDNYLGMLGRGPGQTPRGDGFTLGSEGHPLETNPYADGSIQHAFPMPNHCQVDGQPSQEWKASHEQYNAGKNDGFVTSASGPVSMGYWDRQDLPFYNSLAETFPLNDRWFCSMLGQTQPNRRFLTAATSNGMVNDAPYSELLEKPHNGTIWDTLTKHGLSWRDYYHPGSTTTMDMWLYNDRVIKDLGSNTLLVENFFNHAATGNLPNFCILDPNYDTSSEEDPQDISIGEALSAKVINAVMEGPAWEKTLLIWTYDEHGGYYDHVPPPPALAPDDIAPNPENGELSYSGFTRYGFRVPAVVVSPWARPNFVSHVIHDQTSILAMVERKWNLPALTYRDANANDLTDFLDFSQPSFATPPKLAKPIGAPQACTPGAPGTIPPAGSVTPAPA